MLIVTSVTDNKLEYVAAIEFITQAFPFSEETAKIILGNPKELDGEEQPKEEEQKDA